MNLIKQKFGMNFSSFSLNFIFLFIEIIFILYCDCHQNFMDTSMDSFREFNGKIMHSFLDKNTTASITTTKGTAITVNNNVPHVTSKSEDEPMCSSVNKTLLWSNFSALMEFDGEIDPTFLESISIFWLQSTPPTSTDHLVIAIIYTIFIIVGISGNGLVLFMFIRCRSLRTPANTLVLNLTISDFIMMIGGMMVPYNSFHHGPAMGAFACRIYGFIGGLTGTVSITTLTAIAIDRYNVIVYPLNPSKSTTYLKVCLMLVLVWIYSITFAIIPLLEIGLSRYVPEGFLTACSFDYLDVDKNAKIFMFTYFVFAWCVPFGIITFCYTYILRVVITANSIQSNKNKGKTEIKLAGVVFGIIGLWFLAWTPYSIVALLGITGHGDLLSPIGSMAPALFCKTGACINPYIYAVSHPRFRIEFGRIFLGKRKSKTNPFNSSFSKSGRTRRTIRDVNNLESVVLKDGKPNQKRTNKKGRLERAATTISCDDSEQSLDYPLDDRLEETRMETDRF